jgi:hypothetical protein
MGGIALKRLLDEIDLEQLTKELSEEAEGAKGQRKKKIMKRLKVLEGMHRAGIQPSSTTLTLLIVAWFIKPFRNIQILPHALRVRVGTGTLSLVNHKRYSFYG